MTFQLFVTPFILGFIGGVTPGPILLMAFSEFLNNRNNKLKAVKIILVTVIAETLIALFLITTFRSLDIPEYIFHLISILGIFILITLTIRMFKANNINTSECNRSITLTKVFLLMLFNGPLWIFWITICLPAVNRFGQIVTNGEYLYLIIFEFSMILGISIMFILFMLITRNIRNQIVIKRIYILLGLILGLLVLKTIIGEAGYFYKLLKESVIF